MKVVKVNDYEVPVAQLLYDVIFHEGYEAGKKRKGEDKMTFEEKLEMRRIIITSNLSDESVGRLNELLDKALEEARNEGKAEAVDDMVDICDSMAYEEKGCPLADNDWIKVAARQMKEQNNE